MHLKMFAIEHFGARLRAKFIELNWNGNHETDNHTHRLILKGLVSAPLPLFSSQCIMPDLFIRYYGFFSNLKVINVTFKSGYSSILLIRLSGCYFLPVIGLIMTGD
jgi:hypothetical protein